MNENNKTTENTLMCSVKCASCMIGSLNSTPACVAQYLADGIRVVAGRTWLLPYDEHGE